MNLLGKAIGAALVRNQPGELCDASQNYQPPSLLDGLKQQRSVLSAKLIRLDDAIAALEANPQVADVIQKLNKL
jgi:hypothetical protein